MQASTKSKKTVTNVISAIYFLLFLSAVGQAVYGTYLPNHFADKKQLILAFAMLYIFAVIVNNPFIPFSYIISVGITVFFFIKDSNIFCTGSAFLILLCYYKTLRQKSTAAFVLRVLCAISLLIPLICCIKTIFEQFERGSSLLIQSHTAIGYFLFCTMLLLLLFSLLCFFYSLRFNAKKVKQKRQNNNDYLFSDSYCTFFFFSTVVFFNLFLCAQTGCIKYCAAVFSLFEGAFILSLYFMKDFIVCFLFNRPISCVKSFIKKLG